MFTDIGQKIKTLATILCVILMIAFVISGFVSMGQIGFLGGLLTIIVGVLGSWVGSFVLYGFGELVDCVSQIRDKMYQRPVSAPLYTAEQQSGNSTPVRVAAPTYERPKHTLSGGWRCKNCGYNNSSTAMYCTDCGKSR